MFHIFNSFSSFLIFNLLMFLQSFSLESILGSNISVKILTHQYLAPSFLNMWKTAFFASSQLGGPHDKGMCRRVSPLGSGGEKLPSSPQLSSRPGDHRRALQPVEAQSWETTPDLQVTAGKEQLYRHRAWGMSHWQKHSLWAVSPSRCSISVLLQHSLTFPG